MVYRCLECGAEYDIAELLYTCPHCRGLFLLEDKAAGACRKHSGAFWRRLFDYRRMLNLPALSGIFRYYELIAPVIPLEDIIYLGEGHTPLVAAMPTFRQKSGRLLFQERRPEPQRLLQGPGHGRGLQLPQLPGPAARRRQDPGHLRLHRRHLRRRRPLCRLPGDKVASAVLLPHGKVTPQQLAQPLGSGARVLEIPGVFDDCMKVVEDLADNYQVALLNSKNSWRIRGQESYAFEIAQRFDYDLPKRPWWCPSATPATSPPSCRDFCASTTSGSSNPAPGLGVQSHHADPVYRYYLEPE